MPSYAAFLRGVTPMNAKMPELKRCFEHAGFSDVRTLLSSGNVVFSARAASVGALQAKAEAAMEERLGQAFMTIVRPIDVLRELIERDPYARFRLAANSKRIVTFLRAPAARKPALPIELHGARILHAEDAHVFSAYVPTPHGPVFMSLIEKTFGKDVTTRTWDTVRKVAR
ncbi:MAG: DUF1697 domain-containing protein [Myxococcales bacterium]